MADKLNNNGSTKVFQKDKMKKDTSPNKKASVDIDMYAKKGIPKHLALSMAKGPKMKKSSSRGR